MTHSFHLNEQNGKALDSTRRRDSGRGREGGSLFPFVNLTSFFFQPQVTEGVAWVWALHLGTRLSLNTQETPISGYLGAWESMAPTAARVLGMPKEMCCQGLFAKRDEIVMVLIDVEVEEWVEKMQNVISMYIPRKDLKGFIIR